jgi:hypothetical protein
VKIKIYYASERPDLDESVVLDVLQAKFSPAKDGPRQLLRAGVYRNDRQVRKKLIESHRPRQPARRDRGRAAAALPRRSSTSFPFPSQHGRARSSAPSRPANPSPSSRLAVSMLSFALFRHPNTKGPARIAIR